MNVYDIEKNIKKHRKELHKIPELAFEEYKTSQYISKELGKHGYEIRNIAKTGILAYRKGLFESSIAFRADIDGLNVMEETGLPYSSELQGFMHACGHDGHTATLLGFAEYISQLTSLKTGILFIFQPAEEGTGGAKLIVDEGVFEEYNVKNIFGIHIYPELDQGTIGIRPGAMTAQTGEFDLYIKAMGGHGAMPHKGKDGLVVAAQLICAYQSIVSRNIDPIEGCVLTIGTINGGERRNVIAENVRLEGTIRAFNEETYQTIKRRMHTINKGLMEMFEIQIDMIVRDLYPSVTNDKSLLKIIKDGSIGENLIEINPMMIAEDFSYYQKKVPGLFFMVGSKNKELGYTNPLHSSKFNFHDDVLMDGIKIYDKICRCLDVY